MAVVTDNNFVRGISGLVGNSMIFKTWNGKTFLYAKPRLPKKDKESQKQKDNRLKFKNATFFAKKMMSDPLKKAEYLKKAKKLNLPNAYTAAITEYMRKPEIQSIDTNKYTGGSGEEIRLNVIKKGFEVEAMEVALLDQRGVTIEMGKATKKGATGWIYQTTSILSNNETATLYIRLRERTGNFFERQFFFDSQFNILK